MMRRPLQTAEAAGGQVIVPAMPVGDSGTMAVTLPELGGRVLDGPVDSPFGRIATVADPQGARFQLLEPPTE